MSTATAPSPVVLGTRFPGIFALLSAPFGTEDVKTRAQGGRQLSYITARTAMNRLDNVLGPENWEDDYLPFGETGVKCVLTITLPDGTRLTKTGIGGVSKMSDPKDTAKTGESSALKRAAVKFGVARHLYRDGVPHFEQPPKPKNNSGYGHGMYASPEHSAAFERRLKGFLVETNDRWLNALSEACKGDIPASVKELNEYQADGHLLKWAVETGRLDPAIIPEDAKIRQRYRYTAIVYHRSKADQGALGRELRAYADAHWRRQLEALTRARPDLAEAIADRWGEAGGVIDDSEIPDEAFPDEPGSGG